MDAPPRSQPPKQRPHGSEEERAERELIAKMNSLQRAEIVSEKRVWRSLSNFTKPSYSAAIPCVIGLPKASDLLKLSPTSRVFSILIAPNPVQRSGRKRQQQQLDEGGGDTWQEAGRGGHKAADVRQDFVWGDPRRWLLRVWDDSDAQAAGLMLASVWYCAGPRDDELPPRSAASASCNYHKHGDGLCIYASDCHAYRREYTTPLDSTEIASSHFVDIHCADCARRLVRSSDIFRINDQAVWTRQVVNSHCQWVDLDRDGLGAHLWLHSKGPVVWLTCVCNGSGMRRAHGYWDVRLRLFKIFLVHRKGHFQLTYHKGDPRGHRLSQKPHRQRTDLENAIKADPQSPLRDESVEELTRLLEKATFKKDLRKRQVEERKYLPRCIWECPGCTTPDAELEEVSQCGYVFHRLCKDCAKRFQTCPLCPTSSPQACSFPICCPNTRKPLVLWDFDKCMATVLSYIAPDTLTDSLDEVLSAPASPLSGHTATLHDSSPLSPLSPLPATPPSFSPPRTPN